MSLFWSLVAYVKLTLGILWLSTVLNNSLTAIMLRVRSLVVVDIGYSFFSHQFHIILPIFWWVVRKWIMLIDFLFVLSYLSPPLAHTAHYRLLSGSRGCNGFPSHSYETLVCKACCIVTNLCLKMMLHIELLSYDWLSESLPEIEWLLVLPREMTKAFTFTYTLTDIDLKSNCWN